MKIALASFALASAALVAAASCGGNGGSSGAAGAAGGASGAGGAAGGGSAGKAAAGKSGASTGGTAGGKSGAGGEPAGWKTVPSEGICNVQYPGEGGAQLPAVSWTACPPEWVEGPACEAATVPGYKWVESTPWPVFHRIAADEWVFPTVRRNSAEGYRLYAWESTKGKVFQSFRVQTDCDESLAFGAGGGRFLLAANVPPKGGVSPQGVTVAGALSDKDPSFVHVRKSWSSQFTPAWTVGQAGVFRQAETVVAFPIDNPVDGVEVYSPKMDPSGLSVTRHHHTGVGVFFEVLGGNQVGVLALKDGKVSPFLRYVTTAEAAFNFGTDGEQMVWVHGHEGQTGFYRWKVQDVLVAPTTTDGAVAQKTAVRLRSETTPAIPWGWQVGCGYAASISYVPTSAAPNMEASVRVVRLSDGWSWRFHGPGYGAANTPLGLTCEHVYVVSAGSQVFRVQLDSLGPGEAPD